MILKFLLTFALICQSLQAIENDKICLNEIYKHYCNSEAGIYGHLPVLRFLAMECSSVVDMSRSSVSKWGLLQGLSESSYQQCCYLGINSSFHEQLDLAKEVAKENGIDFTFWRINDKYIEIESTDLLFIDQFHTYCHLTYELETFSRKVHKYICIPYLNTWGYQDENTYTGNYAEYPSSYDKMKRGLIPAITDFLSRHPEWNLIEYHNHNGLAVLIRSNSNVVPPPCFYDLQVDYYLKNKMILCTGPAFKNYTLLKNTVESELNIIPYKKIFVSTNEPSVMNITFNGIKPVCQFLENWGKPIDCTNCIISTLRNAVNDPEVCDDDIIIFKHETLFVNDMELIKRAIKKMINDCNMIVRKMWFGTGTDVFFAKVSGIKEIVKDYPLIKEEKDLHGTNPENYFGHYIVGKISHVYTIDLGHPEANPTFSYSHWGNTHLGIHHTYPSYSDPHAPGDCFGSFWWDKKNYYELFKLGFAHKYIK